MNKNFGFSQKAGILMPVSALPSKYGIGSFGKEAYKFIDFLSSSGQKCWQVLPLNPTSYGDSPYQSPATCAGNPYFIDLEALRSDGLLTKEELSEAVDTEARIDYGKLFNTRYTLLRKAYSRFTGSPEYRRFVKKNEGWLEDYALFMSLKVKNGFTSWISFCDEEKNAKTARENKEKYEEECDFWRFVQFKFFSQWKSLKKYANKKGILIIGDMPIYVAHDSVDVWSATEQFLLDGELLPSAVAGCPPDSFCEDGQLWGNPLYNWEHMAGDGFSWWKARIGAALEMYDILRIDHFRGFASYYSIPYGDENAKRGQWIGAPGKELFEAIRDTFPKAKIIAEDLGFITDDVRELLAYTGFPGMKVLQFAFSSDDSEYLPKNFTNENCVVYTGSHDSDCTKSRIKEMERDVSERFRRECPHKKGRSRTYDAISLIMNSIADLAIVPMQDYLELENDEGRMNIPSVSDGNWQWRMKKSKLTPALVHKIVSVCHGRIYKKK